jgi:hypothetical protein
VGEEQPKWAAGEISDQQFSDFLSGVAPGVLSGGKPGVECVDFVVNGTKYRAFIARSIPGFHDRLSSYMNDSSTGPAFAAYLNAQPNVRQLH